MRDIWKKLGVSMEKKGNRNREYRMERGVGKGMKEVEELFGFSNHILLSSIRYFYSNRILLSSIRYFCDTWCICYVVFVLFGFVP